MTRTTVKLRKSLSAFDWFDEEILRAADRHYRKELRMANMQTDSLAKWRRKAISLENSLAAIYLAFSELRALRSRWHDTEDLDAGWKRLEALIEAATEGERE